MFQIVSQALIDLSEELIEIPAQCEQFPISFQRHVFARLVDSYAALRVCEQALVSIYEELSALAFRDGTPTKVVARNKLIVLQNTVEAFADTTITAFSLQRKQPAFSFSRYFVETVGPKSFWLKPPSVVHLLRLTCPEMITDGKRLSFCIRHPRNTPSNEMARITPLSTTERSMKELQAAIIQTVQLQLHYAMTDIRDRQQLQGVLDNTNNHIVAVTRARSTFSNTIKAHYTLENILS